MSVETKKNSEKFDSFSRIGAKRDRNLFYSRLYSASKGLDFMKQVCIVLLKRHQRLIADIFWNQAKINETFSIENLLKRGEIGFSFEKREFC